MSTITVFIIGAGAGMDLRMPVGSQLKERISKSLRFRVDDEGRVRGNDKLKDGIKKICSLAGLPSHSGFQAADVISRGVCTKDSIDEFIDSFPINPLISKVGKLAIVYEILKAEKESSLMPSPAMDADHPVPDIGRSESTGFNGLYKTITARCSAEDIAKRFKSISVINFNYDRCLEQFLWASLIRNYAISAHEAAKLVKQLKIIHPYGTVGGDPWDQSPGQAAYGLDADFSKMLELSERILTFSEKALKETADAVSEITAAARRFVWLGFGFHDQNMDLLLPEADKPNRMLEATHYATAMKVSQFNCDQIRSMIIKRTRAREDDIHIVKDADCASLLADYKKGLSFPG